MKKTFLFLFKTLALSFALIGSAAFAHEGHSVPGNKPAPHGGMMKSTGELFIELVTENSTLKIYPMDHDSKPLPLKGLKISGQAKLPRQAKTESVKFEEKADHWLANFDAKGAHRFELNLQIDHQGRQEKVKFNVEPNP